MLPVCWGIVNWGENGRKGIVVYSSQSLNVAAFGPHFEDAPQASQLAAQAGASGFATPGTQGVAADLELGFENSFPMVAQ